MARMGRKNGSSRRPAPRPIGAGLSKGNGRTPKPPPQAESYKHPTADAALRPDVGTQAQFRKKKPPAKYRYDSSLSPALDWDGQNSARQAGEHLIAEIAAQAAALKVAANDPARQAAIGAIEAAGQKLRALSKPFLN